MIRIKDLEALKEVYYQDYTVTINNIPTNERRCSVYVVPINDDQDKESDRTIIDYIIENALYDVICDNEEYLIECLAELWDRELSQFYKGYIKNQIEDKNIDPNGKMGLKLVMW